MSAVAPFAYFGGKTRLVLWSNRPIPAKDLGLFEVIA